MRAAVHLAAALALAAPAFVVGRWLRDPPPGDSLLILLGAAMLARGEYRTVGDLVRVAGFGPSRVRGLGGWLKV